jgi:hypothetical protein
MCDFSMAKVNYMSSFYKWKDVLGVDELALHPYSMSS